MAISHILYLSELINKPISDPNGRPIGLLGDLVVRLGTDFPPATGFTMRLGGAGRAVAPRATFLPWSHVAEVSRDGLRLASARMDMLPFSRRQGELLLDTDLLDQQVIDIDGRKLVRVNDVQLVSTGRGGADLRLAGIDVGVLGLLRRLGLAGFAQRLERRFGWSVSDRVIPWEGVEPVDLADLPPELAGDGRTAPKHGLQLTHEKLAALHPADVADLVEQLSAPDRATIIRALEAEVAAETLGEMEPEMQADVLEEMSTEDAADIIAELPPDEAADVLAELPAEMVDGLLRELEPDEAQDILELLAYDEDVAGGMMNNNYIALGVNQTAEETMQQLRVLAPPAEEVYYLYVVDTDEHLLGVLSLRDLIVAEPQSRLADSLKQDKEDIVRVPDTMPRDEVIRIIDKYNLLAVPVVNNEDKLLGVITVDDALAAALPDEPRWLTRLHR